MTQKQTPAKILAIIPAYNEAERLGPVAAAAGLFLPVLVVDDGSGDETANVGRQAGAQVLEQTPNQGKGAALRAGFRFALVQGYDAVITLDADGQHDPAEIPAFLRAFPGRRSGPGHRSARFLPNALHSSAQQHPRHAAVLLGSRAGCS
jgi:Glycosyltransferases involved in cell wall biogenesis